MISGMGAISNLRGAIAIEFQSALPGRSRWSAIVKSEPSGTVWYMLASANPVSTSGAPKTSTGLSGRWAKVRAKVSP